MIKSCIFIIFIFLTMHLFGDKMGVLPDVLKPSCIEISHDHLYVVEDAVVYAYSLKNLKLIKKFGAKGEGPGELKVVPFYPNNVTDLGDRLFFEGYDKIIVLSREFKLLKSFKKKRRIIKLIPVADNFVAIMLGFSKEKTKFSTLSISLLDAELKIQKELYQQRLPDREKDVDMVLDSIHFAVYKDKIYVEESIKDFVIEVFDRKGDRLYEIKKGFEPVKITETDKKELVNDFKDDDFVRTMVQREGGWVKFKNSVNFVFPEKFPPIKDIIVRDDKIYVSTYEKKDNRQKFIIMDLKGNVLSTTFLPLPIKSSYLFRSLGIDNRFYGISNNNYYYIKENSDSEEWELYVTKIK